MRAFSCQIGDIAMKKAKPAAADKPAKVEPDKGKGSKKAGKAKAGY
jgi:hypothetical protein